MQPAAGTILWFFFMLVLQVNFKNFPRQHMEIFQVASAAGKKGKGKGNKLSSRKVAFFNRYYTNKFQLGLL